MSDQFIVIGNQSFNLAHVIGTQYAPAYPGGEQDDEQAAGILTQPRPSRIELTTTEHDWDRDSMGDIFPKSMIVIFRGEEADAIWEFIKAQAADVVLLAKRKREAVQENLAASERWKAQRR